MEYADMTNLPTRAEFEEFVEDGEGLDELDTDELEHYLKIATELNALTAIDIIEDELANR